MMCIHMPPEVQLTDGQDTAGAAAMAQVEKMLEKAGLATSFSYSLNNVQVRF